MPQFTWNRSAEDAALSLSLNLDDVEGLLKQRMADNACEPYGVRGRLRTAVKIGNRGRFVIEFGRDLAGRPVIQQVYPDSDSEA